MTTYKAGNQVLQDGKAATNRRRVGLLVLILFGLISIAALSGDQVLQNAWNAGAARFEVYVTGTAAPPTATQIREHTQVSGALDLTTTVAAQWRPKQITLHASGAVVEACTVKFVSTSSGNPETIIANISAGWTEGYVTLPGALYVSGDEIRVECANSGAATIDLDIVGEGA